MIHHGLGAVLAVILTAATAFAQVRYVKWDATGANNGTSWSNAYATLVDALAASSSGDEIWVSQGYYAPTDAWSSFNLKPGVSIYGGFGGTETQRSQRLPASRPTILTGALDDGNCYHVLYATGNMQWATIDGVTITGGVADGIEIDSAGGGFVGEYVRNLNVINCTFVGNKAGKAGGAVFLFDESNGVYFENCAFSQNAVGSLDKADRKSVV